MIIDFGAHVDLTDGDHVQVADVVVDPHHLELTHVALTAGNGHPTRLVPVGDVAHAPAGMSLPCDRDGFRRYPIMNETSYVRITDPIRAGRGQAVGISNVLTLPHYDADFGTAYPMHQTVAWHRIPADQVEVRRRSRVTTADYADVGHVEGFVTTADHHVTHVVVHHGHLLGRREVVLPLDAVDHVANDRVWLTLTREQVRDLPRPTVRSWWERHRPGRHAPTDAPPDTAPASTTTPRPATTTFHPHGPRPEHPWQEGLEVHDPDRAHDEACHLLANDAADTLLRDGFSRMEIWEWCEAFLAAEGSGSVDDLVSWIEARQRKDAPART